MAGSRLGLKRMALRDEQPISAAARMKATPLHQQFGQSRVAAAMRRASSD
jgi:hypothetical protein